MLQLPSCWIFCSNGTLKPIPQVLVFELFRGSISTHCPFPLNYACVQVPARKPLAEWQDSSAEAARSGGVAKKCSTIESFAIPCSWGESSGQEE